MFTQLLSFQTSTYEWVCLSFCLNMLSTLSMTGIIWLVQLVHYPLMHEVGVQAHVRYAQLHSVQITYLVGPLMLLEALTTLILLYFGHLLKIQPWVLWASFILLGIIWLATAFLSVPCHDVLVQRFDAEILNRLIHSNWVRTIAWTLKSGLLLYILWKMLGFMSREGIS